MQKRNAARFLVQKVIDCPNAIVEILRVVRRFPAGPPIGLGAFVCTRLGLDVASRLEGAPRTACSVARRMRLARVHRINGFV